MPEDILLSWSGGKDSSLALYDLIQGKRYNIAALLTTVTEEYGRISMHGVRRSLLETQAKALGFLLEAVMISKEDSAEQYESKIQKALEKYIISGVGGVASGDIFLEDLRRHREENLGKVGMKGIFPLWKRPTPELARAFIRSGFRAVITCVDSHALPEHFVGREFDDTFLADLPPEVDPCGENGEFHTFVYEGPIFKRKIAYLLGDVVLRDDRFFFCDLLPAPP
jgi:uncharacterized protein (TIGR00290 family)